MKRKKSITHSVRATLEFLILSITFLIINLSPLSFGFKIIYGKMPQMLKKTSPVITILALLLCSNFLCPQSVFEVSSKTDLPILSGAVGGLALGTYLGKNLKPLSRQEVDGLLQHNVPSFDRWACQYFSPKADKVSDITLGICAVSPLLMLTSPHLDRDQKWTYALMYIETEVLTYGITEITKSLTKRIRPYAYNPDVPLNHKIVSSNAKKSFFSGHASVAFASAAFLAQTYASFHPESRWKTLVWCTGLSAATLTGVLRILSGRHFPTDVIIGALVGSFVGFVIPKLHEVGTKSNLNSNRAFRISFQFSF